MQRKTGDDVLPWVEKYRPSNLDDIISQKETLRILSNYLREGRLPHLLFYGPPGTGKTTTILACVKQLFDAKHLESLVLELNASDERGIQVVRDQILTFASTKNIFTSKFKVIIMDEADAMTRDAQNALRRIIEKYTENVRFCLICNYLSKIIPPIQSRCTRFRFAPLNSKDVLSRLEHIAILERLQHDKEGLQDIVTLCGGDMRRALNILQCTSMAFDCINRDSVYSCVGYPKPSDIMIIFNQLLNEDVCDAYNHISEMKIEKGLALQDILTRVHENVEQIKIPSLARIYLIDHIAEIEENLSKGAGDKVQLSSLVSAFQIARKIIATEAKVVD